MSQTQTYDLYFSDNSYGQTESSKYFGISIFLHIALAMGAVFISVPMLQKINEPITIEVIEAKPIEPVKIKPIITEVSRGHRVKATRGAKPKIIHSPRASSILNAQNSDVISAPVKKSKTSRAKMATLKTKTSSGKSAVAKAAPSRVGIPETIEDIAAPQLDMNTVAVAQLGAMGADELESEFKKVDKKSEAALRAQKSEMDAEAKMISDEQDQALAAVENNNKAQARAMNDSLNATRTKNAAVLAQIKASEQAATDRAARDESDRQKALATKGHGSSEQGRGRGESGSDTIAKFAAGSPNAVRSVDSLRQIPGNPKPQYSTDERLNREQGRVIFYAFVTPQGTLEKFKLVQSTGYKNLDGKSLAALRKWKFYPGQQGWVEIPQVWNLKGDIEKMPTLLRRQISRR